MANTHLLDLERASAQYASISDAAQTGLDFAGAQDFTIEFCFQPETVGGGGGDFVWVGKGEIDTTHRAYRVYQNNGDGRLYLYISPDGTAVNDTNVAISPVLVAGTKYHIAVAYDASAGQAFAYINGVLWGSPTGLATTIFDTSSAFYIGSNEAGSHADGLIDDVRAWNTIRTADEIAANYKKELTGSESGLKGYWKLNNNYNDSTANGNNLTSSGSPSFSTDVFFYDEPQAIGLFGNGSDGVLTISSNTTEAPIDSSCSGAAGSNSLSATNASFAAGQIIMVHQSRGFGVGGWELNQIASYVAGTITTLIPLSQDYVDSGESQAQVRVVPQYSSVNIQGGFTYTAKSWDGNIGGILAFICNGKVTVSGTISAKGNDGASGTSSPQAGGVGVGFAAGPGEVEESVYPAYGFQGAGTAAAPDRSTSSTNNQNGNGGGNGAVVSGNQNASGPGGGHATAGQNGNYQVVSGSASGFAGKGGSAAGSPDLKTMVFGGGGGGAITTARETQGGGGAGGGIILIFASEIEVTGAINCNGGSNGFHTGNRAGGNGAGGSILIKGRTLTLGSNLVTAIAGTGTSHTGSVGRIRIEACSVSGTTSPSASQVTGGHSFCATLGSILKN